MLLYLNVAAHLNDLFNLIARHTLLPLLAKTLIEKINKKVAELQVTKGLEICLEAYYSFFLQQVACYASMLCILRWNNYTK